MQFLFNLGNGIGQFIGYILWFFFDMFDNYAFAVICFTVFVKVCMFPFDIKGRRAMAKSMERMACFCFGKIRISFFG